MLLRPHLGSTYPGASAEGAPAATPAATTAAAKPAAPSVAAVASKTTPAVPAEAVPQQAPAVILAGANNSDFPVGEELSWDKVGKLVEKHFDLRPKGIIHMLNLLHPIYQKTAAYGHFGRNEPEFTWEATDKANELKTAAGL